MKLIPPFDTFKTEKHAGEYKDFGNVGNDYPLAGVTYPVDYGDIEGYIAEDGAKLDLFVGDEGNICGYIVVARPDLPDGEHKFFINFTNKNEEAVLNEFAPVVIEHGRFDSVEAMINAIQPYHVEPKQ